VSNEWSLDPSESGSRGSIMGKSFEILMHIGQYFEEPSLLSSEKNVISGKMIK
jgi:hypothetical protein